MSQSSRWLWRSAITAFGAGGFVGLLVSSHYFPSSADSLRALAMIWFFGFGAAKFALDIKTGPEADPRSTNAVSDGKAAPTNGSGGQSSPADTGDGRPWDSGGPFQGREAV